MIKIVEWRGVRRGYKDKGEVKEVDKVIYAELQ